MIFFMLLYKFFYLTEAGNIALSAFSLSDLRRYAG